MPIETGRKLSTLDLLPANEITEDTLIYLAQPAGEGAWEPVAVRAGDLAQWIKTAESIVPDNLPWRGARVIRSTNLTGVSSGATVSWSAAQVDTDDFWSAGAPTRLTIPAGVSKVRFYAGLTFELLGAAGTLVVALQKNGAGNVGAGVAAWRSGTSGFTTNRNFIIGRMEDVTPGDYFEIQAFFSMSGQDQIIADAFTFFEVEILEADLA